MPAAAFSLMAWIGFVIAYWEGLLVNFRLLRSIRRLRGADEVRSDAAGPGGVPACRPAAPGPALAAAPNAC